MNGTKPEEPIVLTANGNDPLDEALAEEGKNEPGIHTLEEMFEDEEDDDAESPDTANNQGRCRGSCPS